jgi:hypothetical protein
VLHKWWIEYYPVKRQGRYLGVRPKKHSGKSPAQQVLRLVQQALRLVQQALRLVQQALQWVQQVLPAQQALLWARPGPQEVLPPALVGLPVAHSQTTGKISLSMLQETLRVFSFYQLHYLNILRKRVIPISG